MINKRNLHHCKRYSVHYKSTYSMLSCHARSLHNLAKVEGIYACLSPALSRCTELEVYIQHIYIYNIAEHCYSWFFSMADGYDMKTLVTSTMCVDEIGRAHVCT